ncbi:MAG TPA: hydrogenase maturation protease [Chloroflexaceae bacterium]|nr:hydrogenase maturation protease [Chloroflexaceae bacterium]
MAVLIAGVGYRNMHDTSVGSLLVPVLAEQPWPREVEVIDMFFGPVHAVHWFQERPGHFSRVVFVSAVERGRPPGSIHSYSWDGALPDPAAIQARVTEAVTGLVSLDAMLVVTGHFGALPADVRVVEVEPAETGWGDGLSPVVAARFDEIVAAVRRAALEARYD